MSNKYGHNIYDNEILDEFNYGSNPTNIWSYLPLNKEKLFNLTCLHSSIYKCRPVSTKHGHNIHDNEILDEFNYGSNPN